MRDKYAREALDKLAEALGFQINYDSYYRMPVVSRKAGHTPGGLPR